MLGSLLAMLKSAVGATAIVAQTRSNDFLEFLLGSVALADASSRGAAARTSEDPEEDVSQDLDATDPKAEENAEQTAETGDTPEQAPPETQEAAAQTAEPESEAAFTLVLARPSDSETAPKTKSDETTQVQISEDTDHADSQETTQSEPETSANKTFSPSSENFSGSFQKLSFGESGMLGSNAVTSASTFEVSGLAQFLQQIFTRFSESDFARFFRPSLVSQPEPTNQPESALSPDNTDDSDSSGAPESVDVVDEPAAAHNESTDEQHSPDVQEETPHQHEPVEAHDEAADEQNSPDPQEETPHQHEPVEAHDEAADEQNSPDPQEETPHQHEPVEAHDEAADEQNSPDAQEETPHQHEPVEANDEAADEQNSPDTQEETPHQHEPVEAHDEAPDEQNSPDAQEETPHQHEPVEAHDEAADEQNSPDTQEETPHQHEPVEPADNSAETGGDEIVVNEPDGNGASIKSGTPIFFILGQSNAGLLNNSGGVQSSLIDLGIEATVINVSAGGQSVASPDGAWNVVQGDGTDTQGSLYTEFLDTVDEIMAETPDAYIAGAIWVQGEADAYSDHLSYYEPARVLFESMHEDTGEEFPIAIVGLSDFQNLPDAPRESVQEAQIQLANDLDYVTLINPDEIIEENNLDESFVLRDGLHYNPEFFQYIAKDAVDQLTEMGQIDHAPNTTTETPHEHEPVEANDEAEDEQNSPDTQEETPHEHEPVEVHDEAEDEQNSPDTQEEIPHQHEPVEVHDEAEDEQNSPDTQEETPHQHEPVEVHDEAEDEQNSPDTQEETPHQHEPVEANDESTHEHGDSHVDTVDLPPPGSNASAAEISTYLDTLFSQTEMHVHDAGSSLAGEHTAAIDLVPREESTNVAIDSGDWFDPGNWSTGEVPADGDRVLIPEGVHIMYGDVSDTELFTVRVDGKLSFATDTDSQLVFDTLVVSPTGTLEIGTADNPVQADVDVNLIIANNGPIDTDWDPMLLSRGVITHGETVIHGATKDSHEKVIDDPMAGDTSVTFSELPEGWQVGDTIIIAGTHYDGYKYDPELGEKRHYEPEDEERTIISIEGNTVHFDEPLVHDHDAPRDDLKTSVANYTRNVSFETQNGADAEVYERGHVMFMHSDDVDVRFAEFLNLGRTDKSEESFDISDFETVSFDSNVQGRYSVHLHRTGVSDLDNPAVLEGNAVYGSPGWGFVHHDSNAVLENNASYDTFGAGFVSETGNETGAWNDNIAIFAQGINWADPKNAVTLSDDQFDTGLGGDGFWLQSRLVTTTNNVAASVNSGFVYFHRDGDDRMIDIPAENFAYGEALLRVDVSADDIPILGFSGNETFAAREGLHIVKSNPAQGHDVWTHLEDFTAWSVLSGAHLEYTSHYIISNFDVVAKVNEQYSRPREGIEIGNNTTEVVIIDATIDGFQVGIDLHKEYRGGLSDSSPELHNFVVINPTFINVSEDYSNYDPALDTILDTAPEVEAEPGLTLNALIYSDTSEGRVVDITGIKTDSLGEVDFPGGTDSITIELNGVVQVLEDVGYWTTSDGQAYTLLDVYFTDRLTGDVYYEKHPLYLNDDVPLGSLNKSAGYYANVKDNGIQDLVQIGDALYAGNTELQTAIPAEPFTPITIPSANSVSYDIHMSDMQTQFDVFMSEAAIQLEPIDNILAEATLHETGIASGHEDLIFTGDFANNDLLIA